MTLKNVWWKENGSRAGGGTICKNFCQRFAYGFFSIIRAVKGPTVLLALGIGLLLLFLGSWLDSTATQDENKARVPIQDIDNFIHDILNGINDLTQELPVQAFELVVNSTDKIQNEVNNVLFTFFSAIDNSYNLMMFGFIQPACNNIMNWANAHFSAPPQRLNLSPITAVPVNLTSWLSPTFYNDTLTTLENDLTAVRIPEYIIQWSFVEEMNPFLNDLFHIPRVIAAYCNIIGSILIAYVGVRVALAFFNPFIPRYACIGKAKGCAICIHAITSCGKGSVKATGVLVRPWIHIPLIIGILMIFVVAIYIFYAISVVEQGIKVPLQKADAIIYQIITQVNNFTETVPPMLIGEINSKTSDAQSSALLGFLTITDSIILSINIVLNDITNAINNQLLSYLTYNGQTYTISIPSVDHQTLGISSTDPLWTSGFLPTIPVFLFNALTISPNSISLEREIGPWVDSQMEQIKTYALILLYIGVAIAALPTLLICYAFWKPWVPRKARHWCVHPDFLEEIDAPAEEKEDTELEEKV